MGTFVSLEEVTSVVQCLLMEATIKENLKVKIFRNVSDTKAKFSI